MWGIQLQHVVSRRLLRRRRAVVAQRPHPGIAPDDVGRRYRPAQIVADRLKQIGFLLRGDRGVGGIAGIILIGGADQREVVLVRDGEADPAVGVLEDVAAVVPEQPPHHDVASFHKANASLGVLPDHLAQHVRYPRPGSVHQHPGRRFLQPAIRLQCQPPQPVQPPCRDAARRVCGYRRRALRRLARTAPPAANRPPSNRNTRTRACSAAAAARRRGRAADRACGSAAAGGARRDGRTGTARGAASTTAAAPDGAAARSAAGE